MAGQTLELINRLEVPEIAGYTIAGGIIAYAYRMPGYAQWRGFASDGGRPVDTPSMHETPAQAIAEARAGLRDNAA